MIRSSISFVNVLLPQLLSKLAMIVFYEVGEVVKVGLVDVSFLFLGGIEIICKDISINLG